MAAIRMVYIDCDTDDCLASTADEGTDDTAIEARRHARALGWTVRRGKDICPACSAGEGPVDASGCQAVA
jgi:hypothetical protein